MGNPKFFHAYKMCCIPEAIGHLKKNKLVKDANIPIAYEHLRILAMLVYVKDPVPIEYIKPLHKDGVSRFHNILATMLQLTNGGFAEVTELDRYSKPKFFKYTPLGEQLLLAFDGILTHAMKEPRPFKKIRFQVRMDEQEREMIAMREEFKDLKPPPARLPSEWHEMVDRIKTNPPPRKRINKKNGVSVFFRDPKYLDTGS